MSDLVFSFKFYFLFTLYKDGRQNKVIDDVYKHPIIGYGPVKSIYKEAKSINNAITINGVK